MTTKKAFILNVASTYLFKIVNIICAFIIPRLILKYYGSEINGLIASITQFLSVIALADMGVGTVVLASLYRPIEEHDNAEISRIVVSARKFYRNLGKAFAVYALALCVLFPFISDTTYDIAFVSTLVLIMGINTFSQYYFGIVSKQYLTANQRRFVVSFTDSIAMIISTLLCIMLIRANASIHLVKLCTAFCYGLSPLFYYCFMRRYYNIDWKIQYEGEPIKQKWDCFAQHVSYYVTTNTDIIVLTVMSGLKDVSVYSVYALVLKGISIVLTAVDSAIQPVLGADFARNDVESLRKKYLSYQLIMMSAGTLLYGCTFMLIVPFVRIYTRGVSDTQYIVPVFAAIITIAYIVDFWTSLLRMMVNVTGSFLLTKRTYIFTALLNVILSVLLVYIFGIVGVAIGTLVSAIYQFFALGFFVYRQIIEERIGTFVFLLLTNIAFCILGISICRFFSLYADDYLVWGIQAVKIFLTWVVIIYISARFVYKKRFAEQINYVKHVILKK